MSRRPPAHTRTGNLIDAPDESALFAVNPCPRAALLPKKDVDYSDEDGRLYWNAMEHEALRAWVEKSAVLSEVVRESYDKDSNYLFFVKQSKTQRENKEAFTLPDEGGQVTLTHAKHPDISLLARVLRVGNSSSSYTARSVRWMLVSGSA